MRRLTLVAVCLLISVKAQPPAERTYDLPCQPELFAASADGTTVWIACQDTPKARSRPTTLYALDIASGRVTELARSPGIDRIVAAPGGDQAVIVLADANRRDQAVLYQRTRRVARLPMDTATFAWSADAKRIFFRGGSTIQSDAWNILGIVTLDTLAVSRRRLVEPAENIYVCPATGHLFAGSTIDYPPDMNQPRRIKTFPAGNFSANCRYVATPGFFHGPVPWRIVETATGRELMHFDLTGEGRKDEFEFHSWNPREEPLFLRVLYPAGDFPTALEVVDLARGHLLESFVASSDEAAWSGDGKWLILARWRSLVFHPVRARG